MNKKTLYFLSAAALLLTACSSSDDAADSRTAGEAPDDTILLSSSVSSATRAATTDDLQDTQFAAGEAVHVDVYRNGETTPYTGGSYTTGASGDMTGSLHYPGSGGSIDIEAYYPATVTRATTTFSVQANQTTADGYRQSDLMYATRLTNRSRGTVHALTFSHALSKVVVNLSAADGSKVATSDATLARLSKVTLNNTLPTANIQKGVWQSATGTAADIDITGAQTDASTIGFAYVSCGLIVPQTLAEGTTFITVTYDGRPLNYKIPAGGKTFEAGKRYIYQLSITGTDLTLQGITIEDWTENDETYGGKAQPAL